MIDPLTDVRNILENVRVRANTSVRGVFATAPEIPALPVLPTRPTTPGEIPAKLREFLKLPPSGAPELAELPTLPPIPGFEPPKFGAYGTHPRIGIEMERPPLRMGPRISMFT